MPEIDIEQLMKDLQNVLLGHKFDDDIVITGSLLFDTYEYIKQHNANCIENNNKN